MVLDIMKAGGLVVAGTDTPNAVNLHGELMSYTMAGMSAFDALKTATVNPAKALGLNAGTIEARQARRPDRPRRRPAGEHRQHGPRQAASSPMAGSYDVNDLVGAAAQTTAGRR